MIKAAEMNKLLEENDLDASESLKLAIREALANLENIGEGFNDFIEALVDTYPNESSNLQKALAWFNTVAPKQDALGNVEPVVKKKG